MAKKKSQEPAENPVSESVEHAVTPENPELNTPASTSSQPVPANPAVEGEFVVDELTDEVLRIELDKFEGPFEVLLYLIKAQEIDIFDIPILKITEQYIRFLEMMREENLDIAGEFLVMAATLIQIKSKMLLPPEVDTEEEEVEEEDPRLELVEKLLEYRKYRDLTQQMATLEAIQANCFTRNVKPHIEADPADEDDYIEVSLYDLISTFRGMLRYFIEGDAHTVIGEGHSVDEKIALIQDLLLADQSVDWTALSRQCRNKIEVVCCFLAILELCKMGQVRVHQHDIYGNIRLFAVDAAA